MEDDSDGDKDEGDDLAAQMDEDFEIGNSFKDEVVPLGLEYYLGVIEQEDSDDEAEEDDGDDSDEDAKPKKKEKKAKGGAAAGAAGANKEECKQQ